MTISAPHDVPQAVNIADRARRRVNHRILPFLFILFVIAYIDRVNVSFAGLEMTKELGFSNLVFGLGAGIFFIGYIMLEIPGTLIVERWSARKWISRILISWGFLASLAGLIQTDHQFYWIRFLLGAAEAGFFPGVVVYLTHWYRYQDRAKAVAMFMAAIPVANIIGAPMAAGLMKIHWFHLSGWRWLLILQGIPAVVLGLITLYYLTDWPKDANWLPEDERNWLCQELENEKQNKRKVTPLSTWQAMRHRDVLLLTLFHFFVGICSYGFGMWLPKIVSTRTGFTTFQVSILTMIPFLGALPAMLIVGWHSDRTGERRWHAALPMFIVSAFLALSQLAGNNVVLVLAFFTVVAAGFYSCLPCLWAMPTTFLAESAAAASIGLINSLGNLGGFVGPYVIGYLSNRSGNYNSAMLYLMVSGMLAGIVVLLVRDRRQPQS